VLTEGEARESLDLMYRLLAPLAGTPNPMSRAALAGVR
jgi:hypothetical protein